MTRLVSVKTTPESIGIILLPDRIDADPSVENVISSPNKSLSRQ